MGRKLFTCTSKMKTFVNLIFLNFAENDDIKSFFALWGRVEWAGPELNGNGNSSKSVRYEWNVKMLKGDITLSNLIRLVFGLNHVMLRRHQGLVQDQYRNEHGRRTQLYKNTWIIARMSTRRRTFLVFMAPAISCFCQNAG